MVWVLSRPFIFFSTVLYFMIRDIHSRALWITLQNIRVNRFLFNTDSLIWFSWLIQTQTRLLLTQPLTLFYALKDLKNLFFRRKTLFFISNSLIISEFPLVCYIYLLFHFNLLFSFSFFAFFVLQTPYIYSA